MPNNEGMKKRQKTNKNIICKQKNKQITTTNAQE